MSSLALLALSGCASFSHKKKPVSAQTGDTPAPPQPTFVGRVTSVNDEQQFVLVEASPRYMPEPGQALKCMVNGEETAIITVSPERMRPFISANIVKGAPHRGDEVYQ